MFKINGLRDQRFFVSVMHYSGIGLARLKNLLKCLLKMFIDRSEPKQILLGNSSAVLPLFYIAHNSTVVSFSASQSQFMLALTKLRLNQIGSSKK
jgi:hypothetical protein